MNWQLIMLTVVNTKLSLVLWVCHFVQCSLFIRPVHETHSTVQSKRTELGNRLKF